MIISDGSEKYKEQLPKQFEFHITNNSKIKRQRRQRDFDKKKSQKPGDKRDAARTRVAAARSASVTRSKQTSSLRAAVRLVASVDAEVNVVNSVEESSISDVRAALVSGDRVHFIVRVRLGVYEC